MKTSPVVCHNTPGAASSPVADIVASETAVVHAALSSFQAPARMASFTASNHFPDTKSSLHIPPKSMVSLVIAIPRSLVATSAFVTFLSL